MPDELIATCRACEGTELTPAFRLPGEDPWVFCGDGEGRGGCGLLQRGTAGGLGPVPMRPGLSWTERHRLRAATHQALEMLTTRDGAALAVCAEAGCQDGALAETLPRWIAPVCIDAGLAATGPREWGTGVAADFATEEGQAALTRAAGHERYDLVTVIGALEEADDPLALMMRVAQRLAEDGVGVIETPYAALALTRTLPSAFHERARAVYMLSVLERIVRAAGLRIVRGLMTETSGGSIRLFVVHQGYAGHDYDPWQDDLARLWDEEASLALHGRQPYRAFAARQAERAGAARDMAAGMAARFEHAYALDGGIRMEAALRGAGLNADHVTAVVGDAPMRLGGHLIETVSEDAARAAPPDAVIAPAWRRREALEQWHGFVMEGGKLIFVEPELQVIDAASYPTELGRALAVTDGPGSVESLRAALSAMRGPQISLVAGKRA